MGFGKLNIWVRNENCEVVRKKAHLHVFDCHGNSLFPDLIWFDDGHTEVQVPPGCYIVVAGVVHGNRYTDKTMVIIRCGEELCVNLVLNRFEEKAAAAPAVAAVIPVVNAGCAQRIVMPLAINALKADVAPQDLQKALSVIIKAAKIDTKQLLASVKAETQVLKENLSKFKPDERKDVEQELNLMSKLQELVK